MVFDSFFHSVSLFTAVKPQKGNIMVEETSKVVTNSPVEAFVGDTPPEKQQWELIVDGVKISFARMVVHNPKFGVAIGVGLRPEGYQGPIIHEPKGGGEVTLPWFRHPDTDEVWVGLLMESRPNMGGSALCVVGGMNSASLTREETARKEGEEEGGYSANPLPLPGHFVNSNRLFFLADYRSDEGVRCCVVQVPFPALTFEDGITTEAHFASGTQFGKKPGAVIFKPWRTMVMETADALALSAIVRLIAQVSPSAK